MSGSDSPQPNLRKYAYAKENMGNSRSRVVPATFKIFDLQTRVRHKNQREVLQLRLKINDLNMEQTTQLTKYTYARAELRSKLRELQHESAKKNMVKLFQYNPQLTEDSTFIDSSVDTIRLGGNPTHRKTPDSILDDRSSTSLLLHDLDVSTKDHNSSLLWSSIANTQNSFDLSKWQWTSKRNKPVQTHKNTSSTMSLKQHSERMNKAIKIAISKAARDRQAQSRRETKNNTIRLGGNPTHRKTPDSILDDRSSTSLLLHDLDVSTKDHNSSLLWSSIANTQNSFDLSKWQWTSKRNKPVQTHKNTSSTMSLKQHSERMNKAIKIAISKAARDRQAQSRRETKNSLVY
ncbi:unnamed protein product [Didymodactylos carnosus]|uniref:Uncharacterized protein n=1 Tax=Didymodactylos carnosus TaxID=1234261 RepID=A0A813NNH9_9BILA|nr:unnamed protein product [Didymodactylos carnosus]CAF3519063.1 unnamed protein product [Didymodactylos carnosus]